MEKSSSLKNTARGSFLSCWGYVKLKVWTKRTNSYKSVGGFGYDPLSYAQNFDEGIMEEDEDSSCRRFSARFAAPIVSTKSLK